MLILNKKRLSIIILIILFGIFTFSYRTAEQEIQEQQPVTATPVSSKVVVLDAGHRNTRWRRLLIEVNTLKAINSNNSIKTK